MPIKTENDTSSNFDDTNPESVIDMMKAIRKDMSSFKREMVTKVEHIKARLDDIDCAIQGLWMWETMDHESEEEEAAKTSAANNHTKPDTFEAYLTMCKFATKKQGGPAEQKAPTNMRPHPAFAEYY